MSRQPEDYLHTLTRRFFIPIILLKTQLGLSILELFAYDYVIYGLTPPPITKIYPSELIKLARDKKIIQLIKEFHNQVDKNYIGFTMCSK